MTDTSDAARFRKVRAVFDGAAELGGEERSGFLDAECGGDEVLRQEVEAMLSALDAPEFLVRAEGAPFEEPLPERIGEYRIQGLLGRGGFGVVYLAEQTDPVEREVALKVLYERPAEAGAALRFEAECQSLARVEHPNVARLYEAGRTEDGRRYLAMELVLGQSITEYCDSHRLGIQERLRLLIGVCEAVQHAHQRAVVHRDLKPSNVLVQDAGGTPVPKVIDFGIAKRDADEAATRTGVPIGTPAYMSPEQATGATVDTRSDVYALGVMLFELLAGDLPFPRRTLSSASPLEVMRVLREEEPRPMTRALQASEAGADAIARKRDSEPAALRRVLSGDLQWVVRRALAKNPEDRYSSVSDLIADLERYLSHQPVSAREPAALYVARKFIRRHRAAMGVVLTVTALLLAGITVLAQLLDAVSEARDDAVDESDRAVLQEYAAHLAAARAALRAGDVMEARRHLLAAPALHRGWEWRHLAAQCENSADKWRFEAPLFDIDWVDDDRLVVRAHPDRLILLNVNTRETEREVQFPDEVMDFELHRESGQLAIDTRAGLHVLDTRTWEPADLLQGLPADSGDLYDEADVRSMMFSADGEELFTVAQSGRVQVFDLDDGSSRELAHLGGMPLDLVLLNGDREVAVGLLRGRLEVLDAASGASTLSLDLGEVESVRTMVSFGEGETLFAGVGNDLLAIDLQQGTVVGRRGVGVEVNALTLSPDGGTLFSAGGWQENRVIAWNTGTLRLEQRFNGHLRGVRGVAVSPSGKRLATASRDQTVRTWSVRPEPAFTVLEAGAHARALSPSSAGDRFASVNGIGQLTVWDSSSLAQLLQVEIEDELEAVALGNERAYVGGKNIGIVELATGEVQTHPLPSGAARSMAVDPKEQWLAITVTGEPLTHVWSLPDMTLLWSLSKGGVWDSLNFDREREAFLLGSQGGEVIELDPRTGSETRLGSVDGYVRDYDSTSSLFPVVGEEVVLLGEKPVTFGAGMSIWSAKVSPEGDRIVTGSPDSKLRFWTKKGVELLALSEAPKALYGLHFIDEGRRIVGISHIRGDECYVAVWNAPDHVDLEE